MLDFLLSDQSHGHYYYKQLKGGTKQSIGEKGGQLIARSQLNLSRQNEGLVTNGRHLERQQGIRLMD